MPTKAIKILAIDPGTKEIGVAILREDQLEYYGVKSFKRRSPPRVFLAAIVRSITELIAEYQPIALAIERTFFIQREADLLNLTAMKIKQIARHHGLAVYEYNPTSVRQSLCQREKATKREMANCLASRYPALARHLQRPTKWEGLYWAHVFDAVAVGLVCFNQIFSEASE